MPSEQVRFLLESIASTAGIAALVAIALELQRARKADVREFLFHTSEKFDAMHEERRIVEHLEFSTYIDFVKQFQKHDKALLKVFNFWESLTRAVKDGVIDKKSAVTHYGRVFMYTFYNKYKDVHHELRVIEGNSEWFRSFDWFAEQYGKLKPGDWDSHLRGNNYIATHLPDSVWVEKK